MPSDPLEAINRPVSVRTGGGWRLFRGLLRVAAAAGLAVDAYVHAHLAGGYDAVTTATVSQGTLFRVEAGLAALAALLVLVVHRTLTDLYAWLVAAGGLALLLIYRYVDVGRLGPVPDMYEPAFFSDKWLSLAGQALAVLTVGVLLRVRPHGPRGRGRHSRR
jgi:hypothetical protein